MSPKRIINGHKNQDADVLLEPVLCHGQLGATRWIELSQRLMDELALLPELQEQFGWRNSARWLEMG